MVTRQQPMTPQPIPQALIPQVQRSQYLADALQQLQTRGQRGFKSWGGMGATLLADAITQHKKRKVDEDLATSTAETQARRTASLLEAADAWGKQSIPGPSTPPIAPTPEERLGDAPVELPGKPTMGGGLGLSEADRAALANMVWGEARGEPPEGQQAVASVALNRAKAQGVPVADVVAQPHQFAGFDANRKLDPAALAAVVKNIGGLADGTMAPTTTADHFYAPRGMPGGQAPSWAQGQQAQGIGGHQFLTLNDQGPARPQPISQPMGAPPPQAPVAQPPAQQAAPPPAPAAMADPQAAPGAPQQDDLRQRQMGVVRALLANPETQAQGQEILSQLIAQQNKGSPYEFSTLTQQGQIIRMDPRTGKAEVAYQGPKDARGEEYGLNPIPIEVGGQVRLFQPSKSGGMREIPIPEGGRFAKNVTMVDRGVDRVGIDPLTGAPVTEAFSQNVAPAAQQKAAGQVAGETQATAQASLPNTLASTEMMINSVDQILAQPDLNRRLGLQGLGPAIPGTSDVDIDRMVDQLSGQVFLSSAQDMRGLGALTENEGKQLVRAKARLDRRQSPEAFRQALGEVKEIATNVAARARAKAAGGGPQAQAPAGGARPAQADADLLAKYGVHP